MAQCHIPKDIGNHEEGGDASANDPGIRLSRRLKVFCLCVNRLNDFLD